jgi:hypothetical protein
MGVQFPRISIGKERFTAITAEGEEIVLGLYGFEFIVADANPAISKIYFSGPYTGDEGAPPACWSDNGHFADVRCSNPQAESCALCRHNVWGSAKSNLTGADLKACQDFKKLAIIPLHEDVEGPYVFRISPAALKNWSSYCNELRKIGGDCGFEITPDLVVTKVFWSEKQNVMDFEFVDFLDEELACFAQEVKDEKEFEDWIGCDQQSQSYPMLASKPKAEPQRIEHRPQPEPVEAEVVEKPKSAMRSATARRGLGRTPAQQESEKQAPSSARAEMQALGSKQGERKMSPVEIAKARARAQMGSPAA